MMNMNLLQKRWQQLPEKIIRRAQAQELHRFLSSVVLPFSAHYRQLFNECGLDANSIRTLEDLQRIPFTTKNDLVNTPDQPQRFRDFLIVPDQAVLSRRPATIIQALARGRETVRKQLEAEFRPIFVTFTTGRSAEPTPFFFTQHDLHNLSAAGKRLV